MAQYPAPVYPTWGQSIGNGINQGFEGIINGMQQAQQQKMASLAFQGQTGFDPSALMAGQKLNGQITPGSPGSPAVAPTFAPTPPQPGPQFDMNSAFQGTPMGQPQAQPNMQRQPWQQPPQQLTPGSAAAPPTQPSIGGQPLSPQQNDMWQQFQQFSSQSRQGAQAKIADVQSQADLREAQAGYYAKKPAGGANSGELTPERQAAGEWAMAKGILAPSELRSRGAATNFLLDGVIHSPEYQADLQSSGGKMGSQSFNPVKAETGLSAKKAEAVAPFSPGAFKVQAGAASLMSQIPDALAAAKAIGTGDIKALNRINQAWGTQISDQNWDELRDRAATIADEFQAQIGAGSDAKLDLAVKLIDTTKSPANIARALNIVNQVATSRKQSFGGDLSGNAPGNSASSPKQGSPESVITITDSTGKDHPILRKNLAAARKRDPGLKVKGQ